MPLGDPCDHAPCWQVPKESPQGLSRRVAWSGGGQRGGAPLPSSIATLPPATGPGHMRSSPRTCTPFCRGHGSWSSCQAQSCVVVWLCACVLVCLCACVPACLPACFLACLSACLPSPAARLLARLLAACLPARLLSCRAVVPGCPALFGSWAPPSRLGSSLSPTIGPQSVCSPF